MLSQHKRWGNDMAASSPPIEAIVFDLDDTLIDWAQPTVTREDFYQPRIAAIHSHVSLLGHRLPPVDEFFQIVDEAITIAWTEAKKNWEIPSIGDVLCLVFVNLGLDVGQIDINEVLRVFDWQPRPGVILFSDTIPVLQELRRRDYKIGMVTNSFLPMWMRDSELQAYGLMEYLDVRISAADVGFLKPHPQIYQKLLDQLQTEPARTVFVGDRPGNDIAGANEVGLISVLMSPPHLDRDLNGVEPDYTISSLSELLPILDKLEADRS
jgi:FMN phosphatase YigB (HAD superfamily)